MSTGRWFRALPGDLQDDLSRVIRTRRLASGSALFRQGEASEGLHCLLSGLIHLEGVGGDGADVLLAILRPGDWTGFLATLDGGPYTLTALCVTDCVVGTLSRAEVRRHFESSVERYRFLVAPELIVSRRNYRYFLEQHRSSALQRLAYRLLDLLRGPHALADEATAGVIRVSQDQLGAATQLSRQRINSLLRLLSARGYVESRRSVIRVVDAAALRRLAAGEALPEQP